MTSTGLQLKLCLVGEVNNVELDDVVHGEHVVLDVSTRQLVLTRVDLLLSLGWCLSCEYRYFLG